MHTKLSNHRNLFNGDCNVFFYNYKANKPGKEPRFGAKAIHRYVDLLADSGVDTFLINPNGQRAWYPSKVVPTAWDGYKRGDETFFYGHVLGQPMTKEFQQEYFAGFIQIMNRYVDLVEDGIDWVAEAVKGCRRRKVSPWVSIRMNDLHGANSFSGSFMNAPLLADARYRLRGTSLDRREKTGFDASGLDFEKREVRDYMMRMIRELVEEYDFEGIELDWTRWACCCNPPASQKTIDMITDWHAEIRSLTQRKAKRTGRPFPMGIRTFANFDFLRNTGVDVRAMARKGLLDFVAPTNSWQTTWDLPHDQWRKEFGDNVAIYGVVEDAPNHLPPYAPAKKKRLYMRYLSASPALVRGNAAGKLVLGADGIETFNYFCTDTPEHTKELKVVADYTALRRAHDLEFLRGKPKHYAFSTGPALWSLPMFEWPEQVPFVLEPQCQRALRLPMCAEPKSAKLALTVQIVVEKIGTTATNTPGVSFNGSWPNFEATSTDRLLFPTGALTHHVPENTAFNYRFPASAIREGWNEIIVINHSTARDTAQARRENSITIQSVELGVDKA